MKTLTCSKQFRAISKTLKTLVAKKSTALLLLFLFIQANTFALPAKTHQDTLLDSVLLNVKNIKTVQDKIDTTLTNAKKENTNGVVPAGNTGYFTMMVIIICVVSLLTCIYLIVAAYQSPKNSNSALGLPDGSVRAIIAVLAILFYILVSLALSLSGTSLIATDITKTLGTLVVAISSFYFGSKTTEQGVKNGVDVALKSTGNNPNVKNGADGASTGTTNNPDAKNGADEASKHVEDNPVQ